MFKVKHTYTPIRYNPLAKDFDARGVNGQPWYVDTPFYDVPQQAETIEEEGGTITVTRRGGLMAEDIKYVADRARKMPDGDHWEARVYRSNGHFSLTLKRISMTRHNLTRAACLGVPDEYCEYCEEWEAEIIRKQWRAGDTLALYAHPKD
jgi:hypothetical protein